jgi:predicted transcriptional regulator
LQPAGKYMEQSVSPNRGRGPRHSILDLAPLELECMSVLWPLGEGTVRDIHRQLAAARPRAYTTIMTIMDRLAQKGIVTRRKSGRAYRYRANLSADEARISAIEKIVTGFFDGSAEALAAHLAANGGASSSVRGPGQPEPRQPDARSEALEQSRRVLIDGTDTSSKESVGQRLDETLP